jgi:dihydrofolate reductase
MTALTGVVATTAGGLMAAGGRMPWRCPEDLRAFKRLTLGHPVVMGRKTLASIGAPLPGRLNVVLSRFPERLPVGVTGCGGVAEALHAVRDADTAFVIGGLEIYELFWERLEGIYHSVIDGALVEPAGAAGPDGERAVGEGVLYFPIERFVDKGWELCEHDEFKTFRRDLYRRVRCTVR